MLKRVLIVAVVLALSAVPTLSADDPLAIIDEVYQLIRNYYYKTEEVDPEQLLHGALRGMIEALGDPYSEFFTPQEHDAWSKSLRGEYSGVGIEIGIRDDAVTVISPLDGTPADRAGVRPGDKIRKVDGTSTDGWRLDQASAAIRGEAGTTVTLTLERADGQLEDFVLERQVIRLEPVRARVLDEAPVGYIRLFRMDLDTPAKVGGSLFNLPLGELDGIILDLRRNPGGFVGAAVETAGFFLERGKVVVSTAGPSYGERTFRSRGGNIPDLPLVVLIDEGTASAAEILAGALQDHEAAVLIGRPTFGKGIIQQELLTLADGSVIKLTVAQYFTPTGRPVHDTGLEPDIHVEWDPDAPDDQDLETALEWILSQSPTPVSTP